MELYAIDFYTDTNPNICDVCNNTRKIKNRECLYCKTEQVLKNKTFIFKIFRINTKNYKVLVEDEVIQDIDLFQHNGDYYIINYYDYKCYYNKLIKEKILFENYEELLDFIDDINVSEIKNDNFAAEFGHINTFKMENMEILDTEYLDIYFNKLKAKDQKIQYVKTIKKKFK